jgi:hypothetical protein
MEGVQHKCRSGKQSCVVIITKERYNEVDIFILWEVTTNNEFCKTKVLKRRGRFFLMQNVIFFTIFSLCKEVFYEQIFFNRGSVGGPGNGKKICG